MSDVTVVVATRDRAERLDGCLRALRELPDAAEVIVVDNGSSDSSAEMVEARHPDVRLIRLARNAGAVARNYGVEAATTPFVAFADDDSGWFPGSLSLGAELLAAHPRLALVAAEIRVGDRLRLDPICERMRSAPLGFADAADAGAPIVTGFLAFAAMVRREAYLRAGGFDPVTFFFGEEERLAYDLIEAGWTLAYCEKLSAWHRPETLTKRARRARLVLGARNRALTAMMRLGPAATSVATLSFLGRTALVPAQWRQVGEFARRVRPALARRRRVSPELARDLRAVAEADRQEGRG